MRPIDADEVKKRFPIMENDFGMVINETLHKELDKIPSLEVIPKDQYEARLKADLKAILTDLKLEIEELDYFDGEEPVNITQELMDEVKNWERGVKDCKKFIQEKIDKLKEG